MGQQGEPERVFFRFERAASRLSDQDNGPLLQSLGVTLLRLAWQTRLGASGCRPHLTRKISTIRGASSKAYGAPRMHAELKAEGAAIGEKRVARLMSAAGLVGASRCSIVATKKRDPNHGPANDLARRNFLVEKLNELWGAGITFVPALAGFLFLAALLDAWSRLVVGWAFSADLKTRAVLDAFDMALAVRKPENVIHHSGQGSQGGFNRSS